MRRRGELRDEPQCCITCTRFTESGEHECDARTRAFSENVLKGTSGLLILQTMQSILFYLWGLRASPHPLHKTSGSAD